MAEKEKADLTSVISKFEDFFQSAYPRQMNELLSHYPLRKSLNVDYRELDRFSPEELADKLVKEPDEMLEAAAQALVNLKGSEMEMQGQVFEPHVRFFNLPERGLLIQDISSRDIEDLISVRGLVSKRAEVMHRVKVALYACQLCDARFKVPVTKKGEVPQVCPECKRRSLKMVEDESYFVDVQRAEAQEMLERVKGGTPAANIELWLEDDLVNSIVPGDNIEITGIMRLRPVIKVKGRPPPLQAYTRYLDVVHIKSLQRDFEEIEISPEDEKKIRELSRDPKLYDRIIKSIAPSIYGHDEVKEAIALQLFGGTKDKWMDGNIAIRDDIHVLLIGDPGSAKTRLLQYAKEIAPKSIYVSGKSVSSAGLTAAAEKDELGDGGWTLKAGALVLASGGIAGVDEFDKIEETDRAALHELMETQQISIAKAGIVARFKAKTAILAAANPKHGRFDPNRMPHEQFDILPTLLSRFDLIFPIVDALDEEKDGQIANMILTAHRSAAISRDGRLEEVKAADHDVLDRAFLRRYIAYARQHMRPILSEEAKERLQRYYVDLRKTGMSTGTVPITPRQIEGLIRLSEASAKVRLSDRVDVADAERAIGLVEFVLRNVSTDKETGRVDIDILSTGTPKSHVDKINTILNIARQLQKEYDEVEIAEIIKEAKTYNIDSIVAERIIEDLIQRAEFYKVRHGFIKFVERYG